MRRAKPLVLGLALVAMPELAAARPAASTQWAGRERVAEATVTVPAKSCAGVVVESDRRVLTAAHCVPDGATELDVITRRGRRIPGSVVYLDVVADLAVIDLRESTAVRPLRVATSVPRAGDRLLFVGRVDRRSRTQLARVTQLGRCPSLPGVNDAVFTTLQARPGDSGAPLVDGELRVVALVHGGAACHIAAPTASLGRMLAGGQLPAPGSLPAPSSASEAGPTPPAGADPATSTPPVVEKTYRLGPFVFEKLANGFRFHFEFKWSSD